MLQSLSIKNFALIDDLKVSFSEGFTIITGETGSGKSILLDALSLVLGKRADLNSLKQKEEKCIIEAEFHIKKYDLKDFFIAEDIDYEDITLIRREILPSGKSRSFINDSPTTLDVLQNLGKILVDIHSQHETQLLGKEDFQFFVIDTLAENENNLKEYSKILKEYRKENKKLSELLEFQQKSKKEYDYHSFILKELQTADLQEGMQEELEEFAEQASNVEDIKDNLSKSVNLLLDEDAGVVNQLRELKNSLSYLSDYSKQYSDFYDRVENAFIDLDDLGQELYDLLENVDFDPKELEKVERKLQKIYDLQKKHSVGSVKELLEIQKKLEKEISQVENIEEDIENQKVTTQKLFQKLKKSSEGIHQKRSEILSKFSEELEKNLHYLGMENARFKIELTKTEEFFSTGSDEISFLFSANKGGNFGVLKKVASGGELSRIMLTIKHILASKIELPTIIFDEIDTGVSGEISKKMGEIMKDMSGSRQVFSITHLPQVAAKGHSHIKVYKEDINGRTTTNLKQLSENERITELAQMLGGNQITKTATEHAKELLKEG